MRVVKVHQPTAFQQRVYDAVCQIPSGQVSTYGAIAKAIGCGSSRAIGQALKHNPYAPDVPCHRVIAGDLTLGGFFGESGGHELSRKRRLLEKEGVTFDEKGRVTSLVHRTPSPRVRGKRARAAD